MAIAFDAATTDTYVGGTSRTIAHTCTGSDRFLLVTVAAYTNVGSATGATYNGVAMTQIGSGVSAGAGSCVVQLFALANPSSGTNNVIVSLGGPGWYYSFNVVSYTGVDPTTPYGTPATASGTSGSPTVDVSSAAGELVVDALAARFAPTVGAGQTERAQINNTTDSVNTRAAMSEEDGAATATMSWTGSGASWAVIGLPLMPAPDPPPPTDITGKGVDPFRTAWAYQRAGAMILDRTIRWEDTDTADSDMLRDFFFESSAGAYSMTADAGVFDSTFQPATLGRQLRMTAVQASFASTFQNASFSYGRRMAADTGTFSSTFNNATIGRQYRLAVTHGGYASTFNDAAFTRQLVLTAQPPFSAPAAVTATAIGAEFFTIDWQLSPGFYSTFRDAGLSHGFTFTADGAVFASTFQNARLFKDPPVIVAEPAFVPPVNLRYTVDTVPLTIDWDIGPTFTTAPQPATLTHQRVLPAAVGAFASDFKDASFTSLLHRVLTADVANFSSTFNSAGLFKASVMHADAVTFSSDFRAALLAAAKVMTAGAGTFDSTFLDAVLTWTRASFVMGADAGLFITTGSDAGLFKHSVLPAATGTFTSTGMWADLYAIPFFETPNGNTGFSLVANYTGVHIVANYTGILLIPNYTGIDIE